MRLLLDVIPPIPPGVNRSYGNFGFYKFGLFCWVYDGYDGQVEWVNTEHFCTEPKYRHPTLARFWLQKNVIYQVKVKLQIDESLPGMIINNTLYNAATGVNMPFKLTT